MHYGELENIELTDPKENNEFCFPRLSMFPEAKPKETLKSRGKKTKCFPRGKSLSRTWRKKLRRNRLLQLTPAGSQICRGFEEHDLIKSKSKVQVVVSLGS